MGRQFRVRVQVLVDGEQRRQLGVRDRLRSLLRRKQRRRQSGRAATGQETNLHSASITERRGKMPSGLSPIDARLDSQMLNLARNLRSLWLIHGFRGKHTPLWRRSDAADCRDRAGRDRHGESLSARKRWLDHVDVEPFHPFVWCDSDVTDLGIEAEKLEGDLQIRLADHRRQLEGIDRAAQRIEERRARLLRVERSGAALPHRDRAARFSKVCRSRN